MQKGALDLVCFQPDESKHGPLASMRGHGLEEMDEGRRPLEREKLSTARACSKVLISYLGLSIQPLSWEALVRPNCAAFLAKGILRLCSLSLMVNGKEG